jgi:hypothetical protein
VHEPVWYDAPKVKRRYGKSDTTLQRWLDDPTLQFPKPILIRGKRFWQVDELDAFDKRMIEQGARLRAQPRRATATMPS